MWILLGIFSAIFLGFHEIFKKSGLNHNAVLPVLTLSSAASAFIFIPWLVVSRALPEFAFSRFMIIPESSLPAHLLFFVKSCIVATAWLFGYFSVKHLPVTLLAPLNASGPVWTIMGAFLLYGERMNCLQWLGVVISIGFYVALTFGGNIRGVMKQENRWILFAFLSILFNSTSALLDKYLVQEYDRVAMQAWFSIYTALVFLVMLMMVWYPSRKRTTAFTFRWSVMLIGLFLVVADFLYFKALSYDGSMVSVLIIVRRASAVLVFAAGALYFKETSLRRRGIVLAGILTGVMLVVLGSLL
jgi:transporter family protein